MPDRSRGTPTPTQKPPLIASVGQAKPDRNRGTAPRRSLDPALPTTSITVSPGDTLWGLAARHRGTPYAWPALYDANRNEVTNPDLILPGQVLLVPTLEREPAAKDAP